MYIEGWHFRNADNTGDNDGSVNFPGKARTVYFHPEVGLTIPEGDDITMAEIERITHYGEAQVFIKRLVLSPAKMGEKALIIKMRGKVTVYWKE